MLQKFSYSPFLWWIAGVQLVCFVFKAWKKKQQKKNLSHASNAYTNELEKNWENDSYFLSLKVLNKLLNI